MDAAERRLVHSDVAAVEGRILALLVPPSRSVDRPPVRQVVLGAGEDAPGVPKVPSLQPAHRRLAHLSHQLRVLGEALVRAPPPLVAGDGHAGGERPVDGGGPHLLRGEAPDLFDQGGVAGGAQADVVREDDRPQHVVVAMHRVHAVEERDPQARLRGVGLIALDHLGPVLEAVRPGIRVPAGQDRAQEVGLDVPFLGQELLVGLRHLAELLFEGHRPEEGPDRAVLGGEVLGRGGLRARRGQGEGDEADQDGRGQTESHGSSAMGGWVGKGAGSKLRSR